MRTRTRTPFRVMAVAAAFALLAVAAPTHALDSDLANEPVCNAETANSATCQGEGTVVDDSGCTDEHVKCGEWADLGECGKYGFVCLAMRHTCWPRNNSDIIIVLCRLNCQWRTQRTCSTAAKSLAVFAAELRNHRPMPTVMRNAKTLTLKTVPSGQRSLSSAVLKTVLMKLPKISRNC